LHEKVLPLPGRYREDGCRVSLSGRTSCQREYKLRENFRQHTRGLKGLNGAVAKVEGPSKKTAAAEKMQTVLKERLVGEVITEGREIPPFRSTEIGANSASRDPNALKSGLE